MFNLTHRPTDEGLVPRIEFDVILAVYCDYNRIGYCDYPEWNLLLWNDTRCDALYKIIEPVEYHSGNGTQELEDFNFDTVYGNEISQPAAFERFFENFGVWQDGDPDYEEPRELIGVDPDNLVDNEDGKPAVFWEEFTDAVMSSREFKSALEWGVHKKKSTTCSTLTKSGTLRLPGRALTRSSPGTLTTAKCSSRRKSTVNTPK